MVSILDLEVFLIGFWRFKLFYFILIVLEIKLDSSLIYESEIEPLTYDLRGEKLSSLIELSPDSLI